MKEILLSQLIALIKCSFKTNYVATENGDLTWRTFESIDPSKYSHTLSIWWKRGEGICGHPRMNLCMVLKDIRPRAPWLNEKRYVLNAYNFDGDNCNERTRFLYKIMADQVDIIDDINLIGNINGKKRL